MSALAPGARLAGIDYSPDCVAVSAENNPKADIVLADVSDMPFEDGEFDLVTAIETVYFWREAEKAFGEIRRVLKEAGTFACICEADGPGRFGPDAAIYDMVMYTPSQLEKLMTEAGFREVRSVLKGDGYMIVTGKK